jgi:ABC-type transport system involved in multi-copper enzyme maturation permease subunit
MGPFRLLMGNPVVLKELRGRMRGPRAFIVLTGFLALVGGFTVLLYMGQSAVSSTSTTQIDGGAVGRALFAGVGGIVLFVVTFIAPAFAAGAISGERERQTYDLLRTTLLPEAQLVMGKLFSALAYIFLLLLSAIPLQSLSFILGGTDLPDMFIALVTLFVTSIFLGTVGIYFSARIKRTLPASIATYGVALGVVIGTIIALFIVVVITDSLKNNNVSQTGDWIILGVRGALITLNPAATLQITRDYLVSQQNPWTIEYTFSSGNTTTLPSPWIVFSVIYLLASGVVFILTTRQIKRIDDI